ncbi:MAG TPA: CHASE domain-containing protein [Methylomirabilota bacterium]|nr:CHASE domain-containing protein [Methylomirabilota bacterium]
MNDLTPGSARGLNAIPSGDGLLGRVLHHPVTAWAILGVSLLLTALAWWISNESMKQRVQDRFAFRTGEVHADIGKRMLEYEQVLRGGVALFAASDEVTRRDWREYVATLRLGEFWPGLQGMGFSLRLLPDEKDEHVARIRAEGFPNYVIHPEGERSEYHSIIYLEPFEGRNLRAFGFDMASESTRRASMERARDTGLPTVSGVVTLVQETTHDVQRGFLMYLPVYRRGVPKDTVARRRAALHGFVYSPFRVNDLMRGILGDRVPDLDFAIFDGDTKSTNFLLYSTSPSGVAAPADQSSLRREMALPLGGRTWTIQFSARPDFVSGFELKQPLAVAVGGLVVDLLLFYVIASMSRQKDRIERLVTERTQEWDAANRALRSEVAQRRRAEEEYARLNAELSSFNRLAIGREHRMIELKRRINTLSLELGRPAPYDLSFVGTEPAVSPVSKGDFQL